MACWLLITLAGRGRGRTMLSPWLVGREIRARIATMARNSILHL